MNERIKELAKDAKYSIEQEGILLELVLEKFAELLIRECMSVIGEENYGMLTGKANCTKIKRHFGVEE